MKKREKRRKRISVLLLVLVLVLTQICLPGANIQAKADTPDVGNEQNAAADSAEIAGEDEPEEDSDNGDAAELKEGSDTGDTAELKEDSGNGDAEGTKNGSDNSDVAGTDNSSDNSDVAGTDNGSDVGDVSGTENGSNTGDTPGTGADSDNNTGSEESGSGENSGEDSGAGSEEGSGEDSGSGEGSGENPGEGSGEESGEDSGAGSEDEKKEPEFDQYHVTFLVTGEDDTVLENAEVTVQKSVDGERFEDQEASSDKVYDLDVKQDKDFLKYKFTVTADVYRSGVGTFCFDPDSQDGNSYFDLDTVGQEFIITVKLDVDPNLYYVEFKAVDENGNPIENPVVSVDWSVDVYGSYPQETVSPGIYILQKKRDNGDWLYYTFRVSKDGYTSHTSQKFCFDSSWPNPYFDVKVDNHFLTITVHLTSLATELDNAKKNAVQELENYKKLEDYRPAEQEKIKELIQTWRTKIENAALVSSVNFNLIRAKEKLDELKTNVEYEDEEYRSRIYFLTDDGQKIPVDEYGVVNITNIDSGNFYITHPDGTLYANNEWDAKWRCVYEYQDLDHPDSIAFQVIVGTYGQYAGKFVGIYNATVALSDLGRSISFTVRVTSGRVDKLRASIDGKDMSGKTLKVEGSEKKTAVIEGRLDGTTRWVSIPQHALKYTAGGSTSVRPATGEFQTWGTSGSITYTLDADRSVSVTVNIEATIVKPTGVKVICPSRVTIGDWNGAFNQYVGIMQGQEEGRYRVEVTPSNASNTSVTWEALTPDVATFQTAHALGIVPKKAGTAEFKVTCVGNPEASTMVTILFQYEKPLKTAEAEKNVYYATTNDKSIDLKIITNGMEDSSKGASEQRFYWSYSTSGVVKVSDSVEYDKSSVTIPNWFAHTIRILGEGTVYVTGTPYDTTENCKPVTFKVVVTNPDSYDFDKAEAERVEKLIQAIGEVTLDKKSQIQHARSEYDALTSTQKGLVDDEIYAILVDAELRLSGLESEESGGGGNGGDNGAGSEEGGGGTPPEQGDTGGDNGAGSEVGGGGNPPEQGAVGDNNGVGGEEIPPEQGASGDNNGVGDDLPQNGANTGGSEASGQEVAGSGTGTDIVKTEAVGGNTENPEKTDSVEKIEEAVEAVQNNNEAHAVVTPANGNVQKAEVTEPKASEASKNSGSKGSGKKFFEVDIQNIQEEIQNIMNEISPAAKAAVALGTVAAFVFGLMWRRRQYLKDKNE